MLDMECHLPCYRWGSTAYRVGGDNAHVFGPVAFGKQTDQNNSFLAMQLSVNLLSWSFKVATFEI